MKTPSAQHYLNRSNISILLSLAACAAFALLLSTDMQGQPQTKEKAKGKAKQTQIKTTVVATGLWHPWSMAWLPNGDMLVTERNGKLRTIRDGRLDPDPIPGVPAVHS